MFYNFSETWFLFALKDDKFVMCSVKFVESKLCLVKKNYRSFVLFFHSNFLHVAAVLMQSWCNCCFVQRVTWQRKHSALEIHFKKSTLWYILGVDKRVIISKYTAALDVCTLKSFCNPLTRSCGLASCWGHSPQSSNIGSLAVQWAWSSKAHPSCCYHRWYIVCIALYTLESCFTLFKSPMLLVSWYFVMCACFLYTS